jgi:hypothetical protein
VVSGDAGTAAAACYWLHEVYKGPAAALSPRTVPLLLLEILLWAYYLCSRRLATDCRRYVSKDVHHADTASFVLAHLSTTRRLLVANSNSTKKGSIFSGCTYWEDYLSCQTYSCKAVAAVSFAFTGIDFCLNALISLPCIACLWQLATTAGQFLLGCCPLDQNRYIVDLDEDLWTHLCGSHLVQAP